MVGSGELLVDSDKVAAVLSWELKAHGKLMELERGSSFTQSVRASALQNQTFKNRSLVVLFPYIYTYTDMDLAIVSLVGITTQRAEP